MVSKESGKQTKKTDGDESNTSGDTRSGMPNVRDPNEDRATEHKSGYGGDGGVPRKSSDETQGKE